MMTSAPKSNPLVSVVVPVFNAERWLPESIADLLGQTLREAEFLFVDDGSTDGSVALLEDAMARDPRVRVLRQNHKFAGCARNLGLDHATGKWFIALDADDRFKPTLLEQAVHRGEETDADIVIFDANELVMPEGKCHVSRSLAWASKLPKETFAPSRETFESFRVLATWNKLHRMDFIRVNNLRYQETFECNDIRFSFLALACATHVAALPKTLLHYRVGLNDNVQSQKGKHPLDVITAYSSLRRELEARGIWEKFRPVFLTRLAYSLLGKRIVEFSSAAAAREWHQEIKGKHLSELGLADVQIEDLLGDDAEDLFMRLETFRTLSFEDFEWCMLCSVFKTSGKRGRKLSDALAALAKARRSFLEEHDSLSAVQREREAAERKLALLRHSFSYRLGFALTWPFRFILSHIGDKSQ